MYVKSPHQNNMDIVSRSGIVHLDDIMDHEGRKNFICAARENLDENIPFNPLTVVHPAILEPKWFTLKVTSDICVPRPGITLALNLDMHMPLTER